MALPEPERLTLMERFDDYSQFWYVPLDKYPHADASLKSIISPTQRSHRYFRELAFLGTGRGQAWYAMARRVANSIPEGWIKEKLNTMHRLLRRGKKSHWTALIMPVASPPARHARQ